jgi:transposase
MEMAMYLVTAVVVEGQSVRKVAQDHGVSKTWLYELIARYEAEGEAGLLPRSRRPHHSPSKVADLFEDEIVRLRKELEQGGVDAGAETIRVHLERAHRRGAVPSVSTIWRVLSVRGFITPQAHKRPRSSWIRFEADLPNECWQMDITHVLVAGGDEVEILNVIDDHSRLCVASRARRIYKAIDVVTTFHQGAGQWGYPASVLSDNGAVFTAAARHGVCVMESELLVARHRLQALETRASPDLRQGGAVPPDPQEVPRRPAQGPFPRRPPGPARRVRGLLQRGAPTPLLGAPNPRRGLRGPQEGPPLAQALRRPTALSDPPGQGQRGQGDPALSLQPLPRRRRTPERGPQRLDLGGRSRCAGPHT